jgi:hypothetical protein
MEATPLFPFIDPGANDAVIVGPPTDPPAPRQARKDEGTESAPDAPADPHDPWTSQFQQLLQTQHGRVRQFLDAQRQRWGAIETQLCRQIAELQGEVLALRGQCVELQQGSARRPAGASDGLSAEPVSRRHELALAEIRELKVRNTELESRLREIRVKGESGQAAEGWEAEKRRILAVLELEGDDDESVRKRSTIEEVVSRTDEIIAEKDREIHELQGLLRSQSDNLGSVAVGAAALEALIDQDAIIHEERQTLQQLQNEWREKLRQAEIDLSVERAKIARREAEIDEKLALLDRKTKSLENSDDALCPTGRPVRGRWLARLGLGEVDEPPPRSRGK